MTSYFKQTLAIAMSLGLLAAAPSSALSAGSSSGSGQTDSGEAKDSKKKKAENKCPDKDKIYNVFTKKCQKISSLENQDLLFEAGREFAYAGDYDRAIETLERAPDQADKRVLNMLGYANRRLGRLQTGIAYYKHAMAIDPKFTLVKEYYGEAMLQMNDVAAATGQLNELRDLCGEDCSEYKQLHSAIENYAFNGSYVPETTTW